MTSAETVPISVAIPSFMGGSRLLETLEKITRCRPRPSEILLHCDGNWQPEPTLFVDCPVPVTLLHSKSRIGPGGGRNACIRAASHDLVASFDDDSWPLDQEYFAQALAIMTAMPRAAVLSPEVYLEEKPVQPQRLTVHTSRYYQGSASIHRRSHYLKLIGFVPLPEAYGLEETDLSLQMHAADYQILDSPWLRAWHDRPLADNAHQMAPWVKNEILLAYLRYPTLAQPWGWWRAWRHVWRNRGTKKVFDLLRALPEAIPHCRHYRDYRHRYPLREVCSHLRMPSEHFIIDAGESHFRIFPSA